MFLRKIIHSFFLLLIAVFININIVDDRFVSPLEDLTSEYHAYELEETTIVFAVYGKKQNHKVMGRSIVVPSHQRYLRSPAYTIRLTQNLIYTQLLLNFHLLNLPPPTLV